jgi:hypothetical protein
MCNEVGVVDLTQAHPVYVIGIFPVNPECWMLVQLCRCTGPDISFDIDVQAVKVLKADACSDRGIGQPVVPVIFPVYFQEF